MDEFDSAFDYQLDDDVDQQLAESMEAAADERAENDIANNNFDEAMKGDEEGQKTEGAEQNAEKAPDTGKVKISDLAHNLVAGAQREAVSFSHHPLKWIGNAILTFFVAAGILLGDTIRAAVFGYSRPFDWQNMQERQKEQETMKKAQEDGKDGNKDKEQDGNKDKGKDGNIQLKERVADDLAGKEDAVKQAQHDIEQQAVDKMKESVEHSNVFMSAVGMTSMYDTDKKELNLFMGNDKCTFDMSTFDGNLAQALQGSTEHTLADVGSELANKIQQSLSSDIPTSEGVLAGLMCSAVIIGNQLDLNDSSPLNSKFSETLASCELPDGKQVSISADRLFENNDGTPRASIELKCMYDGQMFAKMPLSALSNEKAMNESVFGNIKDALLTVMENPETQIVYEVEEPLPEENKSNSKKSAQESIDQLLEQVDDPGKNDVSIQTINKDMDGKEVTCVGQISDLKLKAGNHGTTCSFKLQDNDGEKIKCYCGVKAYNSLQNMLHEGPDQVRIKAKVSCGEYNGKETIELKPQSIVMAQEISRETPAAPTVEPELNPFARVTEGYSSDSHIDNQVQEESASEIENRIYNGEYTEPSPEELELARALEEQQNEMDEATEELS